MAEIEYERNSNGHLVPKTPRGLNSEISPEANTASTTKSDTVPAEVITPDEVTPEEETHTEEEAVAENDQKAAEAE